MLLKDYGYDEVLRRALKSSIGGAREFMKLVRIYYNIPKNVTVPTLLIQGLEDNLVPKESSLYVYNSVRGYKKIVFVKGVNHDIFHSKKVDLINNEIKKFLKNGINNNSKIII